MGDLVKDFLVIYDSTNDLNPLSHEENDENLQKVAYIGDTLAVYFVGECHNIQHLINDDPSLCAMKQSVPELLGNLFLKYHTQLFKKIRGKYALVIYDKNKQAFYGSRDHFGINPLYYYEQQNLFIVASDKKAIDNYLNNKTINVEGLQHYFSFQYVPEPMTLSKDVQLVNSGTYFTKHDSEPIKFKPYFKVNFQEKDQPQDDLIKQIQEVMSEQVETRMHRSKNVGVLLSGGIDSTLIAAIAKTFNPDIKTFSVGFAREGYSEVSLAKESAKYLDIENISRIITPDEYVANIPEIIWHLEDPLADPSCIPLYFAAREAKEHVDAVLSGEGADEFFGGYNIYHEPDSLKIFKYVPNILKTALRQLAETFPDHLKGKSFLIRGTTPLNERYIGNAKMFTEGEKRDFYKTFDENIHFRDITNKLYEHAKDWPFVSQMQYIDINTWLKGDILFKANRISRAHNLEVRLPFVDIKTFEIAREIPLKYKIQQEHTKYIMRRAAEGLVPETAIFRKKLGFPVPIRHWLKHELNDWAKVIIEESDVDHYIDKAYVNNLLETHCQGKLDLSRKIWTILMFMIWHQVFIEEKYSFPETRVATFANNPAKKFIFN